MFHAWLWMENPDGVLAQNNWALPFAKAGLEVPDMVEPSLARAVSLWGSGSEYYQALLLRASSAEGEDRRVIVTAVERASAAVEGELGAGPQEGAEWSRRVAAHWHGLWDRLEADLSRESWDRLKGVAEAWAHG